MDIYSAITLILFCLIIIVSSIYPIKNLFLYDDYKGSKLLGIAWSVFVVILVGVVVWAIAFSSSAEKEEIVIEPETKIYTIVDTDGNEIKIEGKIVEE